MAEAIGLDDHFTPQWVVDLENRLQSRRQKLGHEIGAGAKCFDCKDQCPVLELHFWRKKCKNCKCVQEVHDVAEDDSLRFKILFKGKDCSSKYSAVKAVLEVKVKDKLHKNVVLRQFSDNALVKKLEFDWVPAEVSPLLAADYMNELPQNKIPISGSVGANYRKIQLKKQIPMHDILADQSGAAFTKKEQDEFSKYLENLRENAGIGKILRVRQIQFFEESEPCDVQSAQSSGTIKPISPDIQDMNNGFRNINIYNSTMYRPQSVVSSCNSNSPIFQPIRSFTSYIEPSPRSAFRSLPPTIPGSILRLPSSFKAKMNLEDRQREMEHNMNRQSVNNNREPFDNLGESMYADNEESQDSIDITGVTPLPPSPIDDEEGKEGNYIGNKQATEDSSCRSSTPFKNISFPGLVQTPSKTAERISSHEVRPPPGFKKITDMRPPPGFEKLTNVGPPPPGFEQINDQKIISSDLENANNQAEAASALPETNTEVHQVDKNMECVDCLGIIEFNTVAVFIEKPGFKAAWHPKCFVCKECKELLVDLMYFFHKGDVYCARHYTEKLKIHRCFACDELIFLKEYTMAEGHYYHLNHFCCVECDVELAGHQYVLNDMNENLPTCLNCFETIYAKKCLTCGTAIKAEQQGVRFKDLAWHATPECFKCSSSMCHKSLVNQKFVMVESAPYCSRACVGRTSN